MRIATRMMASAVLALATVACTDFREPSDTTAKNLVTRSEETLQQFKRSDRFPELSGYIKSARGVVILPSVTKAGFIGGAEFGNGILLSRRADNSWSGPAFYTLGAGSFGLQIGIQNVEMMLILRNDNAVRAVVNNQGKFGVDAGLTIGFLGGGVEGSTTTNLGADVLAVASPVIGAFGGVSIEGSALVRRNDLNEGYYGAGATAPDVLFENKFNNPAADPLKSAIGGV